MSNDNVNDLINEYFGAIVSIHGLVENYMEVSGQLFSNHNRSKEALEKFKKTIEETCIDKNLTLQGIRDIFEKVVEDAGDLEAQKPSIDIIFKALEEQFPEII